MIQHVNLTSGLMWSLDIFCFRKFYNYFQVEISVRLLLIWSAIYWKSPSSPSLPGSWEDSLVSTNNITTIFALSHSHDKTIRNVSSFHYLIIHHSSRTINSPEYWPAWDLDGQHSGYGWIQAHLKFALPRALSQRLHQPYSMECTRRFQRFACLGSCYRSRTPAPGKRVVVL